MVVSFEGAFVSPPPLEVSDDEGEEPDDEDDDVELVEVLGFERLSVA